jgi:hypothetical protein
LKDTVDVVIVGRGGYATKALCDSICRGSSSSSDGGKGGRLSGGGGYWGGGSHCCDGSGAVGAKQQDDKLHWLIGWVDFYLAVVFYLATFTTYLVDWLGSLLLGGCYYL